jgi:hypothetical protein
LALDFARSPPNDPPCPDDCGAAQLPEQNMTKLKLAVVVALLAGAALLWTIQHQEEARLRGERDSLQSQLGSMAGLQADNERLSNLVTQAKASLSSEELSELLRLRDEAGMLRRETNQLPRLKEQNDQLRAALKAANDAQKSRSTPSTVAEPPLAVYPKATWAFAGFATPEAAFRSLNWAASNADTNTFMAGMTPEAYAKMFGNASNGNPAEDLKNKINQNTEFRILSKKMISDSEVLVNALGDAEGFNTPAKLIFRNIDGQWKFSEGR